MGNQPSKDKKSGDGTGKSSKDAGFDQYPSFSRSDTKESSKSIRNSLRAKIPGKDKVDSPKTSSAGLVSSSGTALDKSDATSIKSSASAISNGTRPHRGSNASARPASIDIPPTKADAFDDAQPPPSPSQSNSIGKGHDTANIEQAQRSGEVDHVSDAPPSRVPPPPQTGTPKEPILIKKGTPIPRAPEASNVNEGSGSPIEISALKTIDLDDMISRLLDAAYAGKVTKAVCLKNAEITAICQAAREIFLSQPALLELSAPVKIVGDVHGQYTDLIRMFEMCGFPPSSNYLFLGDYVDRGKQSLETILLLLCYKLKFPRELFLA